MAKRQGRQLQDEPFDRRHLEGLLLEGEQAPEAVTEEAFFEPEVVEARHAREAEDPEAGEGAEQK